MIGAPEETLTRREFLTSSGLLASSAAMAATGSNPGNSNQSLRVYGTRPGDDSLPDTPEKFEDFLDNYTDTFEKSGETYRVFTSEIGGDFTNETSEGAGEDPDDYVSLDIYRESDVEEAIESWRDDNREYIDTVYETGTLDEVENTERFDLDGVETTLEVEEVGLTEGQRMYAELEVR